MTRQPNVSASSIAAFKSCPERWHLSYVLGVRLDEDPDNLRQGTNWHLLMEMFQNARSEKPDDESYAFDAAVSHLNARYEQVPATKTPFEWETERTWLTMAFMAYLWYYEGQHFETLVTEHHFKVPIINPDTGRPDRMLPMLQGKIDRMIRVEDRVMAVEHKTTSFDISDDSDYFQRLKMDTQVSVYSYAAERDGWQVQGTLYDVLRKPKSKPRLLTQGEAKKFVKTGEWYGQIFEVHTWQDDDDKVTQVHVNDVPTTEVKIGAKEGTFQFRETPAMFGARLLHGMYEDPTKYFARKEISRTRKDLQRFEIELYNISVTMQLMMRLDNYYRNENVCQQPYPCAYRSICYNNKNEAVHGGETPHGFKRRYQPTIGATDAQETPAPSPSPAQPAAEAERRPASP